MNNSTAKPLNGYGGMWREGGEEMSGFTAEEVAAIYERQGLVVPSDLRGAVGPVPVVQDSLTTGERQPGTRSRHEAGKMNGLERRYRDEILQPQLERGEVVWYGFEKLKLRLANATFYTPDYWLILCNAKHVVDEVKGHWEDDARVKIKLAAEQFPYLHFRAWTYDRKTKVWKREDFF